MIKQAMVTGMSLCMVVLSGVFTYVAWMILPQTVPLVRDIGSLLVWVIGFAAGSAVFWRAIERFFGRQYAPV